MEASCIAGKECGVGVYSPELKREREKTRTSSTRCPSSKKGLPGPCSFFLFFIKNFACFFSFKGPELSSGKSQQPSFFFFFFLGKLTLLFPFSQPKNSPLFP